MKPEDFRNLVLPIGTKIGLWGDYNGPNPWGEKLVLTGKVSEYVVVKRLDKLVINTYPENIDCGILIQRENPIEVSGTTVESSNPSYFVGQQLLVIHRYADNHWDNTDYLVLSYGINNTIDNIHKMLKDGTWRDQATWITSASIMAVLEGEYKSEFGHFLDKYERI